jgi:hypothetical protein
VLGHPIAATQQINPIESTPQYFEMNRSVKCKKKQRDVSQLAKTTRAQSKNSDGAFHLHLKCTARCNGRSALPTAGNLLDRCPIMRSGKTIAEKPGA